MTRRGGPPPAWLRTFNLAEVLLLATVTAWALNATAIKYTLDHGLTPVQFSALRWPIAALIFCGIAWTRQRSNPFALPRHMLRRIALLGVVAVWLMQLAFSYGVDWAGASTASLVFGTLPVFAALYGSLGGGERLTRASLLAIGLSLTGVAVLATGGGAARTAPHVALGSALMLFTAAAFAFYSVAAVPLMREISPLQVNTVVTTVGALLLGLTGVPALVSANWDGIAPSAWLSFGFCVVAATVAGNLLWLLAVDRLGPTHAALYVNLQPFLGALFAVVLLSDHLNALDAVGGAAIGAALIIGRRGRAATKGSVPPAPTTEHAATPTQSGRAGPAPGAPPLANTPE